MYDVAIKIDPKYADAYNGKGSIYNLININRRITSLFIKILISH